MRKFLLALLLVLWAATAQAQVVFDSVTEHQNNNDGSCSFSHTTSASANRVLYVGVVYVDSLTYTTPTYNGVSMEATSVIDTTGTSRRLKVWRLVAPATGTNTVSLAWTDGNREPVCVAWTFTNVDQTTPNDAPVEASGFGTSGTVDATSASNDLVVDFLIHNASVSAITVGAGQTERQQEISSLAGHSVASSTEPGAGTVTMSWSWTGSLTWRLVAMNLNVAGGGGGGGVCTGGVTLLGAGKC